MTNKSTEENSIIANLILVFLIIVTVIFGVIGIMNYLDQKIDNISNKVCNLTDKICRMNYINETLCPGGREWWNKMYCQGKGEEHLDCLNLISECNFEYYQYDNCLTTYRKGVC